MVGALNLDSPPPSLPPTSTQHFSQLPLYRETQEEKKNHKKLSSPSHVPHPGNP